MALKRNEINWNKAFSIVLGILILLIVVSICRTQVHEHLLQDDPMLEQLRLILIDVHPVVQNLRMYKSDKSYTLNKEKVFLCLKDGQNKYYPLNMLIYVTLHEIAHVLCTSQGHTDEFYSIFDSLQQRAIQLGVYTNKIPQVRNYRGSSES